MAAQLSAAQRVVYTTELLENILLHLDDGNGPGTKTILLSQKTNRRFRDTIQGSPELKQSLFLSPTHEEFDSKSTIINALPQTYFISKGVFGLGFDGMLFDIGIFPLGYAQIPHRKANDMWVTFRFQGPAWNYSHSKEASWRKMYVMKCDYRVIRVRVTREGYAGFFEVNCGKLTNPTFGKLFDLAFSKSSIKARGGSGVCGQQQKDEGVNGLGKLAIEDDSAEDKMSSRL